MKAVANGALAWHIDSTVSARVAKFHYGIMIGIPHAEGDEDMVGRPTCQDLDGSVRVNNAWSSIVVKVT